MLIDSLPQIKELTLAQKWELVGELWDEVTSKAEAFEPRPEIVELLEARHEHWIKHPETAVTWEQLQAKLGKA